MDERERDYLKQQIRELARSNRRWKLTTFTLAAALAIVLLVGGVSSFFFGVLEVQRQRQEAMMQMEQTAAAVQAVQLQREQAAQQLQQMEKKD